ncbi:Pentatricopeptide repeat-containing protein [Actinidia chinensis var. chinensis]|uniref:Pentatricopeptide repeat-containing protein n=1 Tax=Actinidia chinensis var. chinensis TaxID=1590841 RepID=A0A2R6QV91_ACTCC|nr:Pentatricopeptide repeat-containing protein [Actinidia chinensis var. chinensis]
MIDVGVRPDDHIYPSATKACAVLSRIDIGRSIHCVVLKTGFDGDVFVGSSVVDMYAKCGDIRDARKVFDIMPKRNVVSWGGMIHGYTQLGEADEALRMFKQVLWEDLDVNGCIFSSAIRVCGNSTLLELGKQIHGLCLKMSYDSSCFVGSALISLYSKCGVIEGAYKVFDEISVKNLGMWNAMLIACAQHAHTNKAFDLFKRMECVGMKPNFITFLCVLYACSHAGLVEEGKYYFELMKKYGLEPGDQHYASMVDLLGRAGKLQDAVSIIDKMPIRPTESVWGALLTGCRIHGDTELAAYAADRVFELGPVSSGMHVLVSNAYAAAGRYEEAAKARKMLRDRGVKKETGLSWVEEGNRVHRFAAGDRRHSKSVEIYKKLEELGDEIERAGYIADTSFVLQEVDSDEKNQAIRYHSERLAIAFGLITFPPGRPIRVMKNLRVCGDCHTAIKFMSKCSGRVIIVRDNNRFHRFEDGKCSCGDYW